MKTIKDFKNIHEGKRCFILGNGPSLSSIDFDTIKDEITFGCNRLYKLPEAKVKYYIITETKDIEAIETEQLIKLDCDYKFILADTNIFKKDNNTIIMSVFWRNPLNKNLGHLSILKYIYDGLFGRPAFSVDCADTVYAGGTVVYAMLQFAAYMGCNPIYLIGQDWFYLWDFKDSYPKHFCEDYNPKINGLKQHISNFIYAALGLRKTNRSMAYAAKTLKNRGIEVYNLTQNSKLKAFEIKRMEDIMSTTTTKI